MAKLTNGAAIRVFQQNITAGGTAEKLTVKIRAATVAFNNNGGLGAGDTITDSGNGFLTAGFKPGDQISVTGATNNANNGNFSIATVTAGVITLSQGNVLVTEAAGQTVKIVAPVVVPEGIAVTIKAKYGNAGVIYLGHSAASAKSTGFTLKNNESASLQVSRTDAIWIDGSTGEGVEVVFEQNTQAGE